MKNTLVIFSLLFLCLSSVNAQKLGHSTLSPFSGNLHNSNHSIYYNSGESFDSSVESSSLGIFEGLLHNTSHQQFPRYYIQVKYFFDENQNGIRDNSESLLRIGSFTLNNNEIYTNYQEQGVLLSALEGDYLIEYNPIGTAEYELTTEASFNISLGNDNPSITIEYGLYKDQESEISIKMVSSPFKCNFPVDYRICVMNYGTIPETGIVWLQMDPRFENIWYNWEPDHMIDSTFVGWDMTINPGQLIVYKYGIIAPEIMDESQLGDLYYTNVNVDTQFGITQEELIQEFLCSYDPNDKLVSPNRHDSLALIDMPISYTIRFQNTGNAPADNVVVADTLSEYFDMNTFRLIDTSHPDELSVVFNPENNHIVNFKFDNIFLPDSTTNEIGSNGFVLYQLSVKEDTPLNAEINNTGHIYFDFNPAIVTNTTSTTVVDTFPVIVSNEYIHAVDEVIIYPNPTKGLAFIDTEVETINVYDIYGRRVYSVTQSKSLDLRNFTSGTYLIELLSGEQKFIKKLLLTD